ncbi:sulfurtransferase complex subunit TusC [Buchnera aphidicola (Hyadaphis tataricae)]|uniref:Sulfurtransferase complex subunit TusC n=1 Tax=Buchnera aphidicola (Hyadaphis tataricae) TaxID=1241859 RepID=A0A4D6Y658_9GAMM|nr:sulfurtransferase complex subunit TusC [Buchnera aphidicola]QCI21808.1 sulfurtransferase complex subunit TusC [Buchnera aphidicola (Hyadaphis tataricae)]
MNSVAVIFTHAPHGTSFGREGLDAVLSISSIINEISLFFIGDGVLQLIKNYKSENILARNYTASFSVLSFYNIKTFYCCKSSLLARGLYNYRQFILQVNILDLDVLRLKLDDYDVIVNF